MGDGDVVPLKATAASTCTSSAILNDGGYGAEFHKFRANKIDPSGAMHGRGDLAGVATGFGLRGATVTQMGKFEGLFKEHRAANTAGLWDVHIDDLISLAQLSPRAFRRGIGLRLRID